MDYDKLEQADFLFAELATECSKISKLAKRSIGSGAIEDIKFKQDLVEKISQLLSIVEVLDEECMQGIPLDLTAIEKISQQRKLKLSTDYSKKRRR
jgi:hypothetical protein